MSHPTHSIAAVYDRLAGEYDRRWRHYIDRTVGAAAAWMDLAPDERLLDVACGTGELVRALGVDRAQVVGCDISLGMLLRARDKVAGRWVQADASRLPLPDASFDRVACVNSFHYFPSPSAAVRELRRVVRPAGTVLLVDWCDDFLTCKLCAAWLRLTDEAFHRMDGLADCRARLEAAGLEVLRADRFRTGWLWGLMRFEARPLGSAASETSDDGADGPSPRPASDHASR